MPIEMVRYSGQEALLQQSGAPTCRELPYSCPLCQKRLSIVTGLCGNRLVQAVVLQSRKIGAEMECNSCGARFVLNQEVKDPIFRSSSGIKEPKNIDAQGSYDSYLQSIS